MKISICSHLSTFELLDKYCEQLIEMRFGRADGSSKELVQAADKINFEGIHEMLRLETPNLHEIGLDRVIAYGHTWSPLHELIPETPFRHGHAISIDMAYSATLANSRKLITDEEHRRILKLFSRAGLTMDHETFNEDTLEKATAAILKTRDGLLRAAVPSPIGSCVFLNDVSKQEMDGALHRHKQIMKEYPRQGAGLDAFVDASDTGECPADEAEHEHVVIKNSLNADGVKDINGSNGINGKKKDSITDTECTSKLTQPPTTKVMA